MKVYIVLFFFFIWGGESVWFKVLRTLITFQLLENASICGIYYSATRVEYLFCGFQVSSDNYALAIHGSGIRILEASFRTFYELETFHFKKNEVLFCWKQLGGRTTSALFCCFQWKREMCRWRPHRHVFSREGAMPRHASRHWAAERPDSTWENPFQRGGSGRAKGRA